ncbi:N-terminal binuclear Zn cluster-containing/DNA binding domain-containing protein [Trichoderma chlorosporum]
MNLSNQGSLGDDRQSHPSVGREEADRVLRLKRRQQAKSCYPCRQRKVKCDHRQPCWTCRKRGHPQICIYHVDTSVERHPTRPERARKEASISSDTQIEVASQQQQEIQGLQTPRTTISPEVQTNRTSEERSGSERYADHCSILSMLNGSTDSPPEDMRLQAGTVLGLQNTWEIYPFLKHKTPQELWGALLRIIPQQQEILGFSLNFRTFLCAVDPIIEDIDALESSLCIYTKALDSGEFQDQEIVSGKWIDKDSIAQVALILAALAAGAHYSNIDSQQKRMETCLDLIQRSFEALQLANFVFQSSLNVVQTLLVLGYNIQNVGQSDGSWALLGITIRLAQALGLHSQPVVRRVDDGNKMRIPTIWQSICRYDSILSLRLGRPPLITKRYCVDPTLAVEPAKPLYHAEVMFGLTHNNMKFLSMEHPLEYQQSIDLVAELARYRARGMPHLQSRESCQNLQQHFENLAIEIHFSFTTIVYCRSVFTISDTSNNNPNLIILQSHAKERLISVLKSFLEFQTLSIIPVRTWSMVQAALSSTVLLSMWRLTRDDLESKDLRQRVVEALCRETQFDDEAVLDSFPRSSNQWLSRRHARALVALESSLRKSHPKQPVEAAPVHIANSNQGLEDVAPMEDTNKCTNFDLGSILDNGMQTIGSENIWDLSGNSPLSHLAIIMNLSQQSFI